MTTASPDLASSSRPDPICRAPLVSLHLDPSGNVRVCELNSLGMLGRIPESRLIDLWNGRRIRRIRDALAARDLSMGCEGCAAQLESGHRDHAHASYYDQFQRPLTDNPPWPVQLELSLSNACNLECVMCNGDLSSSIRARREHLPPLPKVYGDEFFDDLRLFLPHLQRVTFIGGEPFLGAESLRVFDMLIDIGSAARCGVTSNGTVMSERVERILQSLPVEISVSIDGATPETYASVRVGSDLGQVLANVDRMRPLVAHLSLNYCLMVQNWFEFGAMLELGNQRDLDVHVNTVTAPPRFSLYHLPAAELATIVDALEREGRQRGGFGRNQQVWDRQLARLRDHLTRLRTTDAPDASASTGAASQVSIRTSADALARAWADDRGTHVLDVGTSEQIVAVRPDPTDVLGIDFRPLVGGHLTALVGAFTAAFGDLAETDLRYTPDGLEDRLMVFTRNGVRTEMRAVLGSGDPDADPPVTSRWHLAARDLVDTTT